jgi:hypothetical protein
MAVSKTLNYIFHKISKGLFTLPLYITLTKKGHQFSRPQTGSHLPKSPWTGIIQLFQSRESLVSYFPAGDGKIDNLFYSV